MCGDMRSGKEAPREVGRKRGSLALSRAAGQMDPHEPPITPQPFRCTFFSCCTARPGASPSHPPYPRWQHHGTVSLSPDYDSMCQSLDWPDTRGRLWLTADHAMQQGLGHLSSSVGKGGETPESWRGRLCSLFLLTALFLPSSKQTPELAGGAGGKTDRG